MSENRRKLIELTKEGQFDQNTLKAQLERIGSKSIGKTLHRFGWMCATNIAFDNGMNVGQLRLVKKQKRVQPNSDEVFNRQLEEIMEKMTVVCQQSSWKFKEKALADKMAPAQKFDFPLPAEIASHFQHIYDRDAQIRMIHSSVSAAQTTNFEQRNHCLLWGKPGCGKTETILAFEKMIGADNVIKLDATMTTKAGAENLLLEKDVVPPMLFIEELEKCNPLNLPWLLGILDQRGEIIKTNARIGSLRKEAKCLCVATVNNLQELTNVMSGALASRFQHKIYFPRPSRVVLEKILLREVTKIKGDVAWIKPILDYVLDVEEINDPRRAIALLDGREKWLTGDYKNDLITIKEAMEKDNAEWPTN